MFRSYEPAREGYVTLIANYQPLQDAYGGPNYFTLDPEALYEIHVDNNGDAKEDLTFQFRFKNELAGGDGIKLDIGGKKIAVPLVNIGPISADRHRQLERERELRRARGARRPAQELGRRHQRGPAGGTEFKKPTDYIGTKSFGSVAGYEAYAKAHIYDINIPGCDGPGKMFVGQRQESFAVNLGTIFDLVNAPPAGHRGRQHARRPQAGAQHHRRQEHHQHRARAADRLRQGQGRRHRLAGPRPACARPASSTRAPPTSCRRWKAAPGPRSRACPTRWSTRWSSASRTRIASTPASPSDDAQFADYVTNPSLPALIEVLFGSAGVVAPKTFPRADLVAAFLTGVEGVNKNGSMAEMMRLNTALPATPKGQQNSLGAALCFVDGALKLDNPGCDPAGFPNGRRPGDDTVDIALRVVMGYLLPAADAPSGQLGFTDAILQDDSQFDAVFPYLRTPRPGAGS